MHYLYFGKISIVKYNYYSIKNNTELYFFNMHYLYFACKVQIIAYQKINNTGKEELIASVSYLRLSCVIS